MKSIEEMKSDIEYLERRKQRVSEKLGSVAEFEKLEKGMKQILKDFNLLHSPTALSDLFEYLIKTISN